MAPLSLPPQLQDIAEGVGLRVALKLLAEKGGQRVTIPGKIKEDHWLVDLLGLDDARALSQYLTNGSRVPLEIPRGNTSFLAKKRKEIYERIDRGESLNNIAMHCDVTRRYVRKLRALRKNKKPPAPDLFDLLK